MNDNPSDLAPSARLFGRLLVRELDAATLAELRRPEIASALAGVGITVPDDAELQNLAADWFDRFLHPTGVSPMVHSLFLEGNYNGAAAADVRHIAAAAGLTLGAGARGAEPDQIGAILLLWAELVHSHPALADQLAARHFAFAEQPLLTTASRPGFYGDVALATADLLSRLRAQVTHTRSAQP